MTECPCCFHETVGDDGYCTRCGVQTSTGEPLRPERHGLGARPFQENVDDGLLGKIRWKEDHQE